jgi:hypothetical protein
VLASSAASPPRTGIPAPALRCSHLGGSRAGSRDSAAAYRRRGASCFPNCPSSAKTRSYGITTENSGMGLFLHVASLRRLARHRKLVLPERAVSSGTAREPSAFPRSGRPVTNQVTTTPGNTRRSATFSDTDIRLAHSNWTQHDAIRRNRQAWHARGQGFESPKLHDFSCSRSSIKVSIK